MNSLTLSPSLSLCVCVCVLVCMCAKVFKHTVVYTFILRIQSVSPHFTISAAKTLHQKQIGGFLMAPHKN